MSRLPARFLAVFAVLSCAIAVPSTLAGDAIGPAASAPDRPDVVLDAETGQVVEVEPGGTVLLDPLTGELVAVWSPAR